MYFLCQVLQRVNDKSGRPLGLGLKLVGFTRTTTTTRPLPTLSASLSPTIHHVGFSRCWSIVNANINSRNSAADFRVGISSQYLGFSSDACCIPSVLICPPPATSGSYTRLQYPAPPSPELFTIFGCRCSFSAPQSGYSSSERIEGVASSYFVSVVPEQCVAGNCERMDRGPWSSEQGCN